ncbi:hypothetical protein MMC11_002139 [Xylographa trunciseda]|nr:hypothetical protein [Xylographa trunciseda]
MAFAQKSATKLLATACLCVAAAAALAIPSLDPSDYPSSDIIVRDVCVIGGGSSGTYGAVRSGDFNQSVVVVEEKDRLGGHTQTYVDPTTGIPVDIGVLAFHNLTTVTDYFARFNVALIPFNVLASYPGLVTKYADFSTGKLLANYSSPNPEAAIGAYAEQVAKYPYLDYGYDLPDPVPTDLLLSFGDFVTKYSLQDLVSFFFNFNQGLKDFLNQPTIYVMKYVSIGVLQALSTGFLMTAAHDNSLLYEAASKYLGADVLLKSRVIALDRSSKDHVSVLISTPSGNKLIQAKKLLVTIPPTPNNLHGFDLSSAESSLFTQWDSSGYYTSLLRNTGLPPNLSINNLAPNTPYNVPTLPASYGIAPTADPGVFSVFYGSTKTLPNDDVKADIISNIQNLQKGLGLPTTEPEFAIFRSHAPFEVVVSSEQIADGFYRKLGALQGQRNTFYSGAAFHAYDSSLMWRFTDGVVQQMVKAV